MDVIIVCHHPLPQPVPALLPASSERIPNFMTALMVLLTHHSLTLYVIVKIHNHILQHWLPPSNGRQRTWESFHECIVALGYSGGGTAARVSCFSAVALVDMVWSTVIGHSWWLEAIWKLEFTTRFSADYDDWMFYYYFNGSRIWSEEGKLKNGKDSEKGE